MDKTLPEHAELDRRDFFRASAALSADRRAMVNPKCVVYAERHGEIDAAQVGLGRHGRGRVVPERLPRA